MEKKQSSQKFKTFLKKNVYYIIMGICLLAIAAMVTVSVLMDDSSLFGKNDDTEPANVTPIEKDDTTNPVVEPDPTDKEVGKQDTETGKQEDETSKQQEETAKKEEETGKQEDTSTGKEEPTEVPIVMDAPCENINVLCDYSMTALVWNSTLRHYGVHNGIDFGGVDGDNVLCACDGVVTSVGYDILNGYTVTVQHNENISSSYSSLNEPTVTVGQKLKKGDVLGTMGNTSGKEYAQGPHVHFSVLEKGEYTDPYQYMTIGGK